jgi:hypothetical protein
VRGSDAAWMIGRGGGGGEKNTKEVRFEGKNKSAGFLRPAGQGQMVSSNLCSVEDAADGSGLGFAEVEKPNPSLVALNRLPASESQNMGIFGRDKIVDGSGKTDLVEEREWDRKKDKERGLEGADGGGWGNILGDKRRESNGSEGSERSVARWRTPVSWVLDQRRRYGNWGRLSG